MEEPAFAKLNLALHVRGREADGYHRIETIFAFTEAGDRLSVAESGELTLTVEGPFAGKLSAEPDNLVLRAADALRKLGGVTRGAALTLDKQLPVASGLGGGSADAAAALRLLIRFWELPVPAETLLEIARGLGSDVPACLSSKPARGEGRGERLAPLDHWALGGVPVLLTNPGAALGTADVFGAWDGCDRGALDDPFKGRNDLEMPALGLVPSIGAVLASLRNTAGTRLVRMSGSGATCFALYEDDRARDVALAGIARDHPDWWLLASRLRG